MRSALTIVALATSLLLASGALADNAIPKTKLGRLFNEGCRVAKSPVQGCLFANVTGPGRPGPLARGSKQGKACGWNILALFAWGDLRIQTAMRNGGITQISSVDSSAFELLPGFYGVSRYCTVVSGE
jgi:hypothetical protein